MNLSSQKHSKQSASTDSLKALAQLNKQSSNARAASSPLIDLVKQSGLEILSEVKTPLTPILSWFDETPRIELRNDTAREKSVPSKTKAYKKVSDHSQLARLPMKSPACKKCPALSGGLCKCALKRLK